MPVELSPTSEAATLRRFQVTHELVLAAVLAVEIVVFSAIGTNFLTWATRSRSRAVLSKWDCWPWR